MNEFSDWFTTVKNGYFKFSDLIQVLDAMHQVMKGHNEQLQSLQSASKEQAAEIASLRARIERLKRASREESGKL